MHANDREGLERLCRYGARGALAMERFEEAEDGRIAYRMKRPMPDGTTHLLFTGLELLRRVASRVPPPRTNLTRFHGVFAPGAKLRPFLVPAAAASGEEEAPSAGAATVGSCERRQRAPRLDWAGLLRRTFAIDVFSCPRCAGQRRGLAYLTQGAVIRRILRHLQLPEQPPRLAPALGPPQQALWE
ncbi:transposase [Pyxidicoccus xibeiensis]|uniref:transposase n=1 Tax=Pyxidicoccus xibeiensis TaxID=2906759 RepID=UPI00389A84C5